MFILTVIIHVFRFMLNNVLAINLLWRLLCLGLCKGHSSYYFYNISLDLIHFSRLVLLKINKSASVNFLAKFYAIPKKKLSRQIRKSFLIRELLTYSTINLMLLLLLPVFILQKYMPDLILPALNSAVYLPAGRVSCTSVATFSPLRVYMLSSTKASSAR